MSTRLALISLSLGAALLTPLAAHADNWPGSRPAAIDGPKTRAQVLAELAAWRMNPIHADGWAEVNGGDSLRFVGPHGTSTTARNPQAVASEIAAARRMPGADGWLETRSGNGRRFVGTPVDTAQGDVRLAAGDGFVMAAEPQKAESAGKAAATAPAEPKLNDLPVHLRFGRH